MTKTFKLIPILILFCAASFAQEVKWYTTKKLPAASVALTFVPYMWTEATTANVCPSGGAAGGGGTAVAYCITYDGSSWTSITSVSSGLSLPVGSTVTGANLTLPGTLGIGTTVLPNNVVDIRAFGGVCNGTTDNTSALASAHAALAAAGGGTVLWPSGICLVSGQVILPNDNTPVGSPTNSPYSRQVPIRWMGNGPDARSSQAGPPTSSVSGSTIKLTYSGSVLTGAIRWSMIDNPGSGYAVNDTGTIGGTCSGATYKVLEVNPTGGVTYYSLTAAGSACSVADQVATSTGGGQPGTGAGFTIDIRGVPGSAYAKIQTYGVGLFELDHVSLWDPASNLYAFIYTTGTTINIHDSAFFAGGGQDAIIMGGTKSSFTAINDIDAPFQGYDSRVHFNYFHGTRRAVLTQTFIAATSIDSNFVDGNNPLTNGAAFEAYTPGGGLGANCMWTNNRIEMPHYSYAFKLLSSPYQYIAGNDMEDAGAGGSIALGGVYFAGQSSLNVLISSETIDAGLPLFVEDVPFSNTVLNSVSGMSAAAHSQFPLGLNLGRLLFGKNDTTGAMLIQDNNGAGQTNGLVVKNGNQTANMPVTGSILSAVGTQNANLIQSHNTGTNGNLIMQQNNTQAYLYADGTPLNFGSNGTASWLTVPSNGGLQWTVPLTVATLPTCSGNRTQLLRVNDATSGTPGDLAVGGGGYDILVQCIFQSGIGSRWIID